jgi:hypothetical protein
VKTSFRVKQHTAKSKAGWRWRELFSSHNLQFSITIPALNSYQNPGAEYLHRDSTCERESRSAERKLRKE